MNDTYDPLKELSFARTAMTDPTGLPEGEGDDWLTTGRYGMSWGIRDYAVEKIDGVLGSLYLEPGGLNDFKGEARWVLTNLGRLLREVEESLRADNDWGDTNQAEDFVDSALDYIDQAIEALS